MFAFFRFVEGTRSVLGAGAVEGKDAGVYPRIDGQVLEHVSGTVVALKPEGNR